MVDYIIIGSEVRTDFIKILYQIDGLKEPIILGDLQKLSYYRGLDKFNACYYKSNKEITCMDTFDLIEFIVITEYEYLDVLKILFDYGIRTFRFKCYNPYTAYEDSLEDSISINKYFKLKNNTNKMWTELFATVDDEIRLLISANVNTVINKQKTGKQVSIDFDNMNYVPNNYTRNSKIDNQCIFELGSQELKSAQRRFIKGTTFNINKITLDSTIGNFELNSAKPNSLILDLNALGEEDIDTIYTLLINRELKHIYYTKSNLEVNLASYGLDKISTRWEYAN